MLTLITKTQPTMSKLTWRETIKLGKVEVLKRLKALNIGFATRTHYFKLCSLLYKASQTVKTTVSNVVSLADKKLQKASEKVQKATNPHDALLAQFEEFHALADTLLF